MRWSPFAVVLLLLSCGVADSPLRLRAPSYTGEFADQWYDGQAEVCGYQLSVPRYGEMRPGQGVAIFVTEPFSRTRWVKADGDGTGVYPVMKLNYLEDFQTGVYDYSSMISAFVALRDVDGIQAGSTAKVSFSCQEWCGQVYRQVLLGDGRVRDSGHSYWFDEADEITTLVEPNVRLSEDALLMWARSLAGPALRPGGSQEIELLRSLRKSCLEHMPLEAEPAVLKRGRETTTVTVPAGTFEVETLTARISGPQARTWTFQVEVAAPRRVVVFTCSDGYEGRLTGSQRMAYWQMKGSDQAAALEAIGLHPVAPR